MCLCPCVHVHGCEGCACFWKQVESVCHGCLALHLPLKQGPACFLYTRREVTQFFSVLHPTTCGGDLISAHLDLPRFYCGYILRSHCMEVGNLAVSPPLEGLE